MTSCHFNSRFHLAPFAACLLLLVCSAAGHAQDSDPNFPITTDRPTFSDGTTIVPVGHPQIESGVTDTYAQGTHTTTYGEIIYRQALSDDFELRLVNLTYQTIGGSGYSASGLVDPTVGFKWRFQEGVYTGKVRRPELGLELLTTVPIGSTLFRTNVYQPSARLLFQYNTDPDTQIFANLIAGSLGADSNAFFQWGVSGGISYSINPRFAPFIEMYSLLPEVRGGQTGSYADIGFTYLLNKRTQFDIRYGTGFNEHRDGNFVGAGLSYRF